MKASLLVGILCAAMTSHGQVSIQGIVTDGYERLPAVTMLLLTADSVVSKGVTTNASGEFTFDAVEAGAYSVSASMVGHVKFVSKPFAITQYNLHLPEIVLAEDVTELRELTITEQKQFIDQKVDRLVINVQASIHSSGNTMLEVLQKMPGVILNQQSNTITMNGKSGVRIMVNEKIMQVPMDVVLLMLDGMSAANVERIELTSVPSSKYDAEGTGGIIHIITKRDEDLGTSFSPAVFLGARWAEALGGNFSLSHRGRNFSSFTDYSVSRNHNLHIMKMKRQSQVNGIQHNEDAYSHRDNVTIQQNLSSGFEWKTGKYLTWNMLLTAYRRNWDLDASTTDTQYATTSSPTVTGMDIIESNIWQSANGSLGVQYKFNDHSRVDASVDYLYYHNDNPSYYKNRLIDGQGNPDEESEINLTKDTPIRFLVANVDYQNRVLPSLTWEAGVKVVTSSLVNDVAVQRSVDGEWHEDPAFTSHSNLREQVAAGHLSGKWQMGKQWTMNSGLRYEHTHTTISSDERESFVNRKYGYLFPSLSINKELGMERSFHLSYARRITRPTYNDMAPYVFFWGPGTFSAGNTALYPAVADAVTMGFKVKQWLASLQFAHSRNEIVALQGQYNAGTNDLIFSSQNMKYSNTVSLTNAYSLELLTWWEVQTNATIQYQQVQPSHVSYTAPLTMFGINLYLHQHLRLPEDFSIEISGVYQSKSLSGISHSLSFGSLNAGIQKSFGRGGALKLSMDDILGTNNWRFTTHKSQNNLKASFNYNWHNRFIRLVYTRNFGNNKLKSVKVKSGSEEERGRVN